MFDSLRQEYRASLKSSDTEEHIDLAFYRPLGFMWAILCRKLHITPNMVTIASIFIGVAAGICFYPTDLLTNILGLLLLILANSFDSADGQLARLTKQYSRLGRILDGMAGDMWFISIYVCIVLRTVHTVPFFEEHHWAGWALAVCAGLCHARQAAMADYFRQFHLMFVKKDFPTELEDSAAILAQFRAVKWSRPFQKLPLGIYYLYTVNQERTTPRMQALLRQLRADYPDGRLPQPLADELRQATLPLCKWENFLTFNWRSITIAVTILAGYPFLYFVAELTVFAAVYLYLTRRHELICGRFLEK